MTYFLIRPNWKYIYSNIFNPLSDLVSTPPDMFIELLRYSSKKMGLEASIEALNNPKFARKDFKKLPVPETENLCISILEGYYEILLTFNQDFADKYKEKLKVFIEERNLRYTVTPDCQIHLSVPGLLVSQYSVLKKSLSGYLERKRCLNELEISLSRLNDSEGERNLIRISSNLLEGIVVDKTTNGSKTLGAAIPGCRMCFPHESLIEIVKNYYKFLSDYPNLRHGGNPASCLRELKKDDAVLSLSLAISFSAFIADNDASKVILSGEMK